jgi:hypothetical protein
MHRRDCILSYSVVYGLVLYYLYSKTFPSYILKVNPPPLPPIVGVWCLPNILHGIEPNPRPVSFSPSPTSSSSRVNSTVNRNAPTLVRATPSLAARPSSLPLPNTPPSTWLCVPSTTPTSPFPRVSFSTDSIC